MVTSMYVILNEDVSRLSPLRILKTTFPLNATHALSSKCCRALVTCFQFLSESLLPACHHIISGKYWPNFFSVELRCSVWITISSLCMSLDRKTHLRIQCTEQTIKQCWPKWAHAKETPASLLHISKSTLELGYFIYCGWPTVDIGTP